MRAPTALAFALLLPACQRESAPPPASPPATPAPAPLAEARGLLDQGQPDAALAKLQQAPSDAEALYLQGRAWAKKAETAPLPTPPPLASPTPKGAAPPRAPEFKPEELQALEFFDKALAAKPDYAAVHLGLAELLAPHALERLAREREAAAAAVRGAARRRGRKAPPPEPPPPPAEGPDASVDRVVRAYRQAVQGDPASKTAVEALIQFAVQAGRLEEAEAAFQELVRRDKENADPLIRYGDFLAQTRKDPQAAIAQYSQALIWRPDDEPTRTRIADLYIEMAAAHLAKTEYASAEARLKDAQRYVTERNSPQGLKIQDLTAQLGQIRRPGGK